MALCLGPTECFHHLGKTQQLSLDLQAAAKSSSRANVEEAEQGESSSLL